jgi:hypothetical protein
MAYFVIDRIEGSAAVVVADDGREFEVPRRALPEAADEGTVLRLNLDHPLIGDWSAAAVDEEERARRQRQARKTLGRMMRSDPGGDIQL